MKLFVALLSGLLATTVTGVAIPNPHPEAAAAALAAPEPNAEPDAWAEPDAFADPDAYPEPLDADELLGRAISDADILKAATLGWSADVAAVSGFLDAVAQKKFTQKTWPKASKAAWAAEIAEWALKEILAEYLLDDQGCKASNSTLTTGDTWAHVNDLLYQLTKLDWKRDQAKIQDLVNKINFGDGTAQGRCTAILPAFDVFFAAANTKLQKLRPGDTSLANVKSRRPIACGVVQKRDILEAE